MLTECSALNIVTGCTSIKRLYSLAQSATDDSLATAVCHPSCRLSTAVVASPSMLHYVEALNPLPRELVPCSTTWQQRQWSTGSAKTNASGWQTGNQLLFVVTNKQPYGPGELYSNYKIKVTASNSLVLVTNDINHCVTGWWAAWWRIVRSSEDHIPVWSKVAIYSAVSAYYGPEKPR